MFRSKWMLLSVGFLTACGCGESRVEPTAGKVTSADVKRDVARADKTAAEFAAQSKDEYQQQLDARLKEVDVEIAKLQAKSHDLKDQSKIDWEQKLTELRIKRDSAENKLAEVRHASGEAWIDMKQGAQSAWAELDVAFGNAVRHF